MGRFLIISLILLLAVVAFASDPLSSLPATSLDPTLLRDLARIEQYNAAPSETIARQLEAVGIEPVNDPTLRVFLYFADPPSDSECEGLEAFGVKIIPNSWLPPMGKEHPLGFLLAEVKVSTLKAILSQGLVFRAAAAYRHLKPLNDLAAQATGAATARQQAGLTGAGVRLAVIDSGFDLSNPDFPEPVIAKNYANFPDSSDDVSDPGVGHGTHVAGILFGSGESSGGRWMGMAPGADPICIRIGSDDMRFSEAAAVYGIRAAGGWMNADVISLSIGSQGSIPDGSSPMEQAVDWAVSQGATCFAAAGNSATSMSVYNGVLGPGQSSESIGVLIISMEMSTYLEFGMSWWDDQEHRPLSVEAFNDVGQPLQLRVNGPVSSQRGTETLLATSVNPLNGFMFFEAQIVVTNNSDEEQDYHLFPVLTEEVMTFLIFPTADGCYTVGAPASADEAIAVGAFVTRDAYTAYNGAGMSIDATVGALCDFSSRGPRIDGRLKPELCAPGQILISLRDRDVIRPGDENDSAIVANDGMRGQPGEYLAMSGTSMAAPCAAGCAALVLEAHPNYTSAQLREALLSNCREDEFVWETPNIDWGYGKINILQAVSVPADQQASIPTASGLTSAYPNPFNSQLTVNYTLAAPGEVELTVFDLAGRQMQTLVTGSQPAGNFKALWEPGNSPSGLYLVRMKAGVMSSTRKVMLLR